MPSNFRFPILDSSGNATTKSADFADMFASREYFIDANLYAFGNGAPGTIGNNANASYSSPVQVGSLNTWKELGTSGPSSASIKSDGTLWTWGNNLYGQLAKDASYSSPVQVGSLTNWSKIYGGIDHTHFIKTDGSLWSVGRNNVGQLGLNVSSALVYSSPVQVGSLTNWKQVSTYYATAAIKTDGSLWVWGSGQYGATANGSTTYSSPIQIGTLTDWKQVSMGYHAMAIKTNGSLWGWGRNDVGQLGLGNNTNYSSPIQIGTLTNWKQVVCGGVNTYAIKTDGTLWVWGNNPEGQLGLGGFTPVSSPVQLGSLTNWKKVFAGKSFSNTFAIKTDGTLWAWGYNAQGQLGVGNMAPRLTPVQVGTLNDWYDVSSQGAFTLALRSTNLPI